jgi:ribosomal protein RSM22 (predicted rRNA methylase)
MKTLTVTALATILVTALILPVLPPAHAATIEDGRKQISPKSFGAETKTDMNGKQSIDKIHKGNLDQVKKEDMKKWKKAVESFKALKFMKTYYKI